MEKKAMTRRKFFKSTALGLGAGLLNNLTCTSNPEKDNKKSLRNVLEKVPRKQFGSTGESVPILGLGCAQKFDHKYDKILHRAYNEGVNYLDTSIDYPLSHQMIATFIGQIGDRKNLWITSKGDILDDNSTVERIMSDVDVCLRELNTNYLDMFLLHAVEDEKHLAREYIQMAEKLKKQKKIKFFGFSAHGANVVALLNKAAQIRGIDAIMFRYHFGKYGDLELNKAIDACKDAGIGLIAMKTQDAVPEQIEKVVAFKSENFTLGQAKLKAVWEDERIDSIVSHMDNTKFLAENILAAKTKIKLGLADFRHLLKLAAYSAPYSCQGCAELCESKLEGSVAISNILRYLMYYECYGEKLRAVSLYRQLSEQQRLIEHVDFTKATAACPQKIKIRERLAYATRLLG